MTAAITNHRRSLLAARERARAESPQAGVRRRALVFAALLPVALAASAPTAANAANVVMAGAVLSITESRANEANRITVRPFGSGRVLVSDTVGETGGTGCRVFNGDMECPTPQSVQVVTGGGDDRAEYRVPTAGIVHLGEGNDTIIAGTRERIGQMQEVFYTGGGGYDVINYVAADQGVTVDMADRKAEDGRPGDRENVIEDFEFLYGSEHRDTLLGTPGADSIAGLGERDLIAGGGGDDMFYSPLRDGADDYHGGPGSDTMVYIGRTRPLNISLDNTTNDGEAGEFDLVRSNVENVMGGDGADTLNSFSAFSRLEGFGGADTLIGGDGPDTLIGGAGADNIQAGAGADVVDARDGGPDAIDCGTEKDTLTRDAAEGVVRGCEQVAVGVLRLADRTVTAKDGRATVELRWRHPRDWRSLKGVTLRILEQGVPVGKVTIDPAGQRVRAQGAVTVGRRAAKVTRKGKDVTARVTLGLQETSAKRLAVEVEAADKDGRRQLVRDAGSIAMG